MMKNYKLLFLSIYVCIFETIKYLYHGNKNKSFINCIETLAKYNIFYVKLFQSIGTNTKLFNNEQCNYMLKFLDNVPYNKCDEDDEVIADIIDVSINNDKFKSINTITIHNINCGMIAIVYKTTMQDNNMNDKDIIIKVKKKGIDNKVRSALDETEVIIDILNILPFFKFLQFFYLKDIFVESKKLLLDQLDFNNEICNLKKFYNSNKNTDYVTIPEVYDSFTNKNSNVIVMDYINGVKFCDLEEINKPVYSKLIAKFSFKSLLFDGLFHADLHGGNIIFIDQEKIGIIDFGIVGNITREEQDIYYKFLKELFINKNYNHAASIIISQYTIQINEDNFDMSKIINIDIFNKIEEIIKLSTNYGEELDFYNFYSINEVLANNNLKLSSSFYKIQYSIGTSYSLCSNLSICAAA